MAELHITLSSRRGQLGNDLYKQLRAAILDGRLATNARLPATRELAERLDVSRNIVLAAFDRLIAEGYATTRVGAGTFVAPFVAVEHERRARPAGKLVARSCWQRAADARGTPIVEPTTPYDLRVGAPDGAMFPWAAWRSALSHELRGRKARADYGAPAGASVLRAAIARQVAMSRAVVADADDVLVTSGAQQALDLISRVMVEPGSAVGVEEPGYVEARRVFELAGARVMPVPVDTEGLDVARIPAEVKLVYVTPSHQFPLGMAMSLQRRLALLAWAERRRAAIVEDDYDSEFRFDGRPLEPLQSLDRAGRVVYVGTFSKVLMPSLRTGFIVAPASIMPALQVAKQVTDQFGQVELQRALAALVDDGTFARHVRRSIRVYRRRRDTLLAAVAAHLGDKLDLVAAAAGLHVSGFLRDRRADVGVIQRRARDAGVLLHTLAPYYIGRPRAGIPLGFGMIQERNIGEAIRRLARIL